MKFEEIFAKMEAVVQEAKKRGLLEHYEDDFFVHDRALLLEKWIPSASSFIWVLTPNGTHLAEIGIHEKQEEWAKACVNSGYQSAEIFHLSSKGIKPVSKQEALQLAKQADYRLVGRNIENSNGDFVASMDFVPVRVQARQGSNVTFTKNQELGYTARLKHALNAIALQETVRFYGSLFVVVDSVVFN